MIQYKQMIQHVLANGRPHSDRTGVGTLSTFGYQTSFDLRQGFPAVTTKKLAWKAVVGELLWFLEGSTDERRLAELTYGKHRRDLADKTTIWTANADNQGVALGYENNYLVKELGPIYGHQWTNFGGINQIKNLIKQLKTDRDSRRMIVSAWNVPQLSSMALVPCHLMFQFRVYGNELSCQIYIRSNDVLLGTPFNIASYALLTHLIAREVDMEVGDLVYTVGDLHIYNNHIDGAKEVLNRVCYDLPELKVDKFFDFDHGLTYGFKFYDAESIELKGYHFHPPIKLTMAV